MAKSGNPEKTKKWLEPIEHYHLKCYKWALTCRFKSLIIAAGLGSLLVGSGFPEYFIELFKIDGSSRFIDSFQLLVLALPVVVLLWVFRTHDTKTQIEKSQKQIEKSQQQTAESEEQLAKSEKQINQASYFKGLDNLASNDLLKTAIGVRQLVALRKITKEYDRDIVIAVEKLFQLREVTHGTIDAEQIDFSEIYLSGAELNYAKLIAGKLIKADLSGAILSGANLSYAKLMEADLSGARLVAANLSHAKLMGADLNHAKLNEAKLSHACLSLAKLTKAELSGAKLLGADLSGADLNGAFYATNIPPKNIDFEQLGYSLEEEKDNDNMPIIRLHKKSKTG